VVVQQLGQRQAANCLGRRGKQLNRVETQLGGLLTGRRNVIMKNEWALPRLGNNTDGHSGFDHGLQ
jgi:hypothetical protein